MLGSKDIFLDRAKRELSVMQMNHCGIQECEKGHMWQFQARPYHLLHFVLHGEGSLKISGRMLNVHAGQAFFIPAGIEGKYIASGCGHLSGRRFSGRAVFLHTEFFRISGSKQQNAASFCQAAGNTG